MPPDERIQHLTRELVAAQLLERAVPPADGRPDGVDDQRVGHGSSLGERLDRIADAHAPRPLHVRPHAEVDVLAVAEPAVALDQTQRVEIPRPGLGSGSSRRNG